MRWLRDAMYLTAATATAPIWAWRMHRTGKLRTDWRARFGQGAPMPRSDRPRILIHAVSVGEVNAIRMLIARLAADATRPELVISVTTDTGIARAQALFGAEHAVVRYPFDASWMVDRFLDRVRPDLVALAELEVWPNFVAACAGRKIPVVVINGRLSARSFGRYRAARSLLAPTFAQLEAVLAQHADYAARFQAMGVEAGRTFVTGTMKWDTAQIADSVEGAREFGEAMGIDPTRPLVVAGSTEPAEHALLRDAVPAHVQLLCAPRKPEWFEAAAATLDGCARRSKPGHRALHGRFLLDTIGELRKAYALADIVVIGRSFGDLHGSDPMEPAALGKSVVIGPRYGDFDESVNVLRGAGAIACVEAVQLPQTLRRMLGDPQERSRMGAAAQAVVRSRQGATERTAEALLAMLPAAHTSAGAPEAQCNA